MQRLSDCTGVRFVRKFGMVPLRSLSFAEKLHPRLTLCIAKFPEKSERKDPEYYVKHNRQYKFKGFDLHRLNLTIVSEVCGILDNECCSIPGLNAASSVNEMLTGS
jgi:hypothetical protein